MINAQEEYDVAYENTMLAYTEQTEEREQAAQDELLARANNTWIEGAVDNSRFVYPTDIRLRSVDPPLPVDKSDATQFREFHSKIERTKHFNFSSLSGQDIYPYRYGSYQFY